MCDRACACSPSDPLTGDVWNYTVILSIFLIALVQVFRGTGKVSSKSSFFRSSQMEQLFFIFMFFNIVLLFKNKFSFFYERISWEVSHSIKLTVTIFGLLAAWYEEFLFLFSKQYCTTYSEYHECKTEHNIWCDSSNKSLIALILHWYNWQSELVYLCYFSANT